MINNMALSGFRENVILTKSYLSQVAPLDVQNVTHGGKGGLGPPFGAESYLPVLLV